jgi:murein L,D-transpeptidase YafK
MADSAGTCRAMIPTPWLVGQRLRTTKAGCMIAHCTVAAGFCLSVGQALAQEGATLRAPEVLRPEMMLIKSLEKITESRIDSALSEIEQLLKTNPNFRLAHLIKGDLLLARVRPISNVGETPGIAQQDIDDLRQEAWARAQRYRESIPMDMTPKYLLQMQPEQKYAVIADTGKSRLYIYQNVGGQPRYLADYYISSGKNGSRKLKKGDKKTPVGVYFVTDNLPREKLTDFYGGRAFPINYPNEWDKKQGRSGFGIWLHGTPSDTYSRPPRASDGCVVLANDDLNAVAETLQVGVTPVIISDRVEWVKPSETAALRKKIVRHLEKWRQNWESGNIKAYIANYGRNFSNGSQNRAEWLRHLRQAHDPKNQIKVNISNESIFLYPGREDLVVVNFDEEYSSDTLSNKVKKRQYWMKENKSGAWKIIYEGVV